MKPKTWAHPIPVNRDVCALSTPAQDTVDLTYSGGGLDFARNPVRDVQERPGLYKRSGDAMSFDERPDPDRVFLDALSSGKLLVQNCTGCGAFRAPPSESCPDCGDARHVWKASVGKGRLERAIHLGEVDAFGDDPEITRAIGAVKLAEGPTVSVRLIGVVPAVGTEVSVEVLSGSLIAQVR